MQVEEASSLTPPENEHHYFLKIDGWFQMIHFLFKMVPFFGDVFGGVFSSDVFVPGETCGTFRGCNSSTPGAK